MKIYFARVGTDPADLDEWTPLGPGDSWELDPEELHTVSAWELDDAIRLTRTTQLATLTYRGASVRYMATADRWFTQNYRGRFVFVPPDALDQLARQINPNALTPATPNTFEVLTRDGAERGYVGNYSFQLNTEPLSVRLSTEPVTPDPAWQLYSARPVRYNPATVCDLCRRELEPGEQTIEILQNGSDPEYPKQLCVECAMDRPICLIPAMRPVDPRGDFDKYADEAIAITNGGES